MDVVVPVTVDPADDVLGINLVLTYDSSVVTATGVTLTPYTNGWTLVHRRGGRSGAVTATAATATRAVDGSMPYHARQSGLTSSRRRGAGSRSCC